MISKEIAPRKDGKSSAQGLLNYGEGLKSDESGELPDKSHRTRITGFDLVDDAILIDADLAIRQELMSLCAMEMQANCDLNQKVAQNKKIAHLMISFWQERPSEEALISIEDRMMKELGLSSNHRVSFLHNDNGHWHLHVAVSRIEKGDEHRSNPLWRSRIKRDFVCREMELKWGLKRDNGYHYITPQGDIKQDPTRSRNASTGDRAQSMEKHAGLLSFQGWAVESGLSARLKDAGSWNDLHRIAGEFDCSIKPRGAGFVIVNRQNEGQAAKLSQIGVTSLAKRLGDFQPPGEITQARTTYEPEPIVREKGERLPAGRATHEQWQEFQEKREDWRTIKRDRLEAFKQSVQERRQATRNHFRELKKEISADRSLSRAEKEQKRSLLSMQLVQEEIRMREQFKAERAQLASELKALHPGNTFRDYLAMQAAQGDERALEAMRRYANAEGTKVNQEREEERRPSVAHIAAGEQMNNIIWRHPVLDLQKTVHRNGSVDYDLGGGRVLTDDAQGKIRFSKPAVRDADAVETGLLLAQKRFGFKLELTGPDDFKRFAVETAVNRNIRVTFTDPQFEAYRQRLVAEKEAKRMKARDQVRRPKVPVAPLIGVGFEKSSETPPHAPKSVLPGVMGELQRQHEASPTMTLEQSRIEAEKIAKDMGFVTKAPNTERGFHVGKIIGESQHHLLQDVGRRTVVIHQKQDLQQIPSGSNSFDIRYQKGKAVVNERTQSKNLTRGR